MSAELVGMLEKAMAGEDLHMELLHQRYSCGASGKMVALSLGGDRVLVRIETCESFGFLGGRSIAPEDFVNSRRHSVAGFLEVVPDWTHPRMDLRMRLEMARHLPCEETKTGITMSDELRALVDSDADLAGDEVLSIYSKRDCQVGIVRLPDGSFISFKESLRYNDRTVEVTRVDDPNEEAVKHWEHAMFHPAMRKLEEERYGDDWESVDYPALLAEVEAQVGHLRPKPSTRRVLTPEEVKFLHGYFTAEDRRGHLLELVPKREISPEAKAFGESLMKRFTEALGKGD